MTREPSSETAQGQDIYEVWNSFNSLSNALYDIPYKTGKQELKEVIKPAEQAARITMTCIDHKAIGAMDIIRACREENGKIARAPHPRNTIYDLQEVLSRALDPRQAPYYSADELLFDTKYSYREKTSFNDDGLANHICRAQVVHLISNPDDFMKKYVDGLIATVGAENFEIIRKDIEKQAQRIVEKTKKFAADMEATKAIWSSCNYAKK